MIQRILQSWIPVPRTPYLLAVMLITNLSLTGALHGQDQPGPQQSDQQSELTGAEPMKVVITGVQGIVQVRANEQAVWAKATQGMELGPGVEFRTGPRSAVRLLIPPDQTITLDRLGTIKVLTALRLADNKVKTDLGMKYGRTRYDIEKAGIEYESKIYSPSATLAVRGSMVGMEDTALGTTAWSLQERVSVQPKGKPHAVALGGTRPADFDTETDSAAETATVESVVDPGGGFAARTEAEAEIIQSYNTTISTAGDEPRAIRTQEKIEDQAGLSPGTLDVLLEWVGMGDLDLFLIDPFGKAVSSFRGAVQGSVTQANGGVASDDHVGPGDVESHMKNMCPPAVDGCEFIRYKDGFPTKDYVIGVAPFGITSGVVTFDIQVIHNDVPLTNFADSFNASDPPPTPKAMEVIVPPTDTAPSLHEQQQSMLTGE